MAIKRIAISNFKSFKHLEIELGRFNILVGANASGKSNFIQAFKFLRDILNHGLDNAMSMQGGVGYLRNINLGGSQNFSIQVVSDESYMRVIGRRKQVGLVGMRTYETENRFAIKFKTRGFGFDIAEDRLTQRFELVKLQEHKGELEVEVRERIGK